MLLIDKKINILHIIDHNGLGGAQRVLDGILKLKDNRIKLNAYALRKKENEMEITDLITCDSYKKYSLKPFKELLHLIKINCINILHCHLLKSQIFGWVIKKFYYPKVILIFHEHGRIFRNSLISANFLRFASRHVDLSIAVSKATKNKLIQKTKINSNKIVVMHNFIDLKKFNHKRVSINDVKRFKYKLGIKDTDFVIGFAGRLVERKGWKDFIKAAILLSKNYVDMKFLIAGDGSDRKRLLNMISKNYNIAYLGYFDQMDIFYKTLDCFVIPSQWEPMGLTELEAQAMGTSVIASNVDGLNEVIKDKENCLFFEPRNSKDLVKKIETIYSNKELKTKLISNGFQNVKKYSLNKYNKNLERIYKNLKDYTSY